MNLTILLGNGFDIKLGLKTGYRDFYQAFLSHNQSSFIIFDDAEVMVQNVHPELCKMIEENRNLEYWADLEILLGKSINMFSTIEHLKNEKNI